MNAGKIGKILSLFLFISAIAAMAFGPDSRGAWIFEASIVQLIYSAALFVTSFKYSDIDSKSQNRLKLCCWIGIGYIVSLAFLMAYHQLAEFGLSAITVVNSLFFAAIGSIPFIWCIRKAKPNS